MEQSQSASRAIAVLRCLTVEEPEQSVADISRALGIPKTIVGRLVATLESEGMLVRRPGARFRLGPGVIELGSRYVASNDLYRAACEAAEELARATGHASYLGTLQGRNSVILHRSLGKWPIQLVVEVTRQLPATTSAIGKAMLAQLTPQALEQLLGQDALQVVTNKSIATPEALSEELRLCRERGYSTVIDEYIEGLASVGAAIVDKDGSPVAGLSVAWMVAEYNNVETQKMGEAVADAARHVQRVVEVHQYAYGRRGAVTEAFGA